MTIFAECVTRARVATAGKAVSGLRVVPLSAATMAKRTMVMTGANKPRAFATMSKIEGCGYDSSLDWKILTTCVVYNPNPTHTGGLVHFLLPEIKQLLLNSFLHA